MPTPEDQAREHIDQALEQAGWRVQGYKSANLQAGRGVALRKCRSEIGRTVTQRFFTGNQ
jgi:type I restriction enzyme R subunit